MITTTTPTIEGKTITAYHGLVFGDVFGKYGFFKNPNAATLIGKMKNKILNNMVEQAIKMGANAIVGISFDFEAPTALIGSISATGTAVTVE